ncbi:DUF3224 domain-containing protein [Gluconacetobacter azotocaptans]|uniref:DUF3224 domain-containing protein n=1 Tax=Gluconacetobacter azotocaptans TaxID=142834 RepID=A0A7W4PHF3_9PROT|nr:DUF3224 domain-containing protein [Gluconacetobacter azotocaptans]MBB2191041.1 DUF3224 domain-containing protein [Gluconacetobacter azotocaptans]
MTSEAIGRFDVEMKPEASFGDGIGRFAVTKRFHGHLEGAATGEMLAVRTGIPGSAGYVLMEQVTGTLHGRSGAFVLQHHGLMDRGRPELTVTVVPDSGTGGLAGISGGMTIDAAANHSYVFTYSLPDPAAP